MVSKSTKCSQRTQWTRASSSLNWRRKEAQHTLAEAPSYRRIPRRGATLALHSTSGTLHRIQRENPDHIPSRLFERRATGPIEFTCSNLEENRASATRRRGDLWTRSRPTLARARVELTSVPHSLRVLAFALIAVPSGAARRGGRAAGTHSLRPCHCPLQDMLFIMPAPDGSPGRVSPAVGMWAAT